MHQELCWLIFHVCSQNHTSVFYDELDPRLNISKIYVFEDKTHLALHAACIINKVVKSTDGKCDINELQVCTLSYLLFDQQSNHFKWFRSRYE